MSKSLLSSDRSKAYALLLLNSILWGIAPPIIKVSLNFVSINQFLLGRYLLASLVFIPIYFYWRKEQKTGIRQTSWRTLIFLGILGTPLTLIPLYEGIKLTSSIEAAILAATTPILVILGGRLFLKEKITPNQEVGIFVALAGTLLLALEPALTDGLTLTFSVIGNLLIIGSNLIWVVFLLIVKKQKTDSSQLSLVSYLVSIPFFLILFLMEPAQTIALTKPGEPLAIFGILYMAIFGSVIAFYAYAKGQALIPAGEASVFTYLQPIFTFPLAYFWLGERVSVTAVLACLLIAAGVYFSEYHQAGARRALAKAR